jgi:hypothetical protein
VNVSRVPVQASSDGLIAEARPTPSERRFLRLLNRAGWYESRRSDLIVIPLGLDHLRKDPE